MILLKKRTRNLVVGVVIVASISMYIFRGYLPLAANKEGIVDYPFVTRININSKAYTYNYDSNTIDGETNVSFLGVLNKIGKNFEGDILVDNLSLENYQNTRSLYRFGEAFERFDIVYSKNVSDEKSFDSINYILFMLDDFKDEEFVVVINHKDTLEYAINARTKEDAMRIISLFNETFKEGIYTLES